MSIMIYNFKVRFWYKISNYITIAGVRTILRHLHRCPKVKTNFATCPKLGHGREHDLGHILVLRYFQMINNMDQEKKSWR